MKIKTKDNKGITLIVLIFTIIIMLVLTSVIVYTGFNTYEYSKESKFLSQMKLLQEKADNLVESNNINLGVAVEIVSPNYNQIETIITAAYENLEISSSDPTSFRYFSEDNLREQLDIEDINDEILINFTTREVVSLYGVEYEGQVYYTQYLLPGGQKIIQHQQTNSTLAFELDTYIEGLNANVNIMNVQRTTSIEPVTSSVQQITNGIIKYKLLPDDDTVYANYNEYDAAIGNWENVLNNNINLTVSGRYVFSLSDTIGTTKVTQELTIKLANAPKLTEQITVKAKYDIYNNTIIIPTIENGKWYDYSENSSNWAYAIDGQETPNNYIWIPRFAYKTETDEGTGETFTVIKFLKGNSNIPTDNSKITIDANNWIIPTKFTKYGQYLRGVWIKLVNTSNLSNIDVVDFLNNTTDTNIITVI